MKKYIVVALLVLPQISHATAVSDALMACIRSSETTVRKNVVIDYPDLEKVPVDGTSGVTLNLKCSGDVALKLYHAANDLGPQYGYQESKWSHGETVRTIYLGGAANPSECNREVLDANNQPVDRAWCSILLDLNNDLVKNLDLDSSGAIKTTIVPGPQATGQTPKKIQSKGN